MFGVVSVIELSDVCCGLMELEFDKSGCTGHGTREPSFATREKSRC